MIYRPPLVMALGSAFGYKSFAKVMENVDLSASRNGAIYLVEHLKAWPEERDIFRRLGISLEESEVDFDTKLEAGKFYVCPESTRTMRTEPFIDYTVAIENWKRSNGDGYLRFNLFEIPLYYVFNGLRRQTEGFGMNIRKAMEAGYRNDMLVSVLTGMGDDGIDILKEARDAGAEVLVQDPNTAGRGKDMPKNVIESGHYNLVLTPEQMGQEISHFLNR